MKSHKYILRFGKDKTSEVLTTFIDKLTIFENLEKIIPLIVEKGLVEKNAQANELKLIYNETVLNSSLPLEEQVKIIQEYEIIDVEHVNNYINIQIRFTPDNHAEQVERMECNLDDSLDYILLPLYKKISQKYKFRSFKRKKYKLFHNKKQVNARKQLRKQNITTDSTLFLKPKILLGWPPRFLEYFLMTLIIVGTFLCIYLYFTKKPVESFRVTLKSDTACRIYLEDTLFDSLSAGGIKTVSLNPGIYPLVIKPKENPIFSDTIFLNDLYSDDSLEHIFNIKMLWGKKSTKVKVKILGYFDRSQNPENRIENRIIVNGYTYLVAESGPEKGTLVLNLTKGITDEDFYEIQFELDDSLFESVYFSDNIYSKKFQYGFSGYSSDDYINIIFYYNKPKEQ